MCAVIGAIAGRNGVSVEKLEPKSEYLTVQEAAEYLGASRFKVARLIADGHLNTFTTPLDKRRRLVSRIDLDRLMVSVIPEEEDRYTHEAA